MERPVHPRQTLRKALYRLAPTCRVLWSNTRWIVDTIAKVCASHALLPQQKHIANCIPLANHATTIHP